MVIGRCSISGDYENGWIGQLPESIGNLIRISIITPDYPNKSPCRCFGVHFERFIATFDHMMDALKRRFDFFLRKSMRRDFVEIPIDPLESTHKLVY